MAQRTYTAKNAQSMYNMVNDLAMQIEIGFECNSNQDDPTVDMNDVTYTLECWAKTESEMENLDEIVKSGAYGKEIEIEE